MIISVLDVAQSGNWIPNLINWLVGFVVVVVLDYFLDGVVWCYGNGPSGKSWEVAVTPPETPRAITPIFLLHFFPSVSKHQGSDKFRQRAKALRRVSIMLLLIALFKGRFEGFLWRGIGLGFLLGGHRTKIFRWAHDSSLGTVQACTDLFFIFETI